MSKKGIKEFQKNVNVLYVFLAYVVFALAFMIVVALFSDSPSYRVESLFDDNAKTVTDDLSKIIAKQNAASNKIKKAVSNKNYTLEDPYILKNPYGLNPLSAVIVFNTDKEVSVTVTINDKQVGTTESSKEHIIPVYGLFASLNNIVELLLSDGTYKIIFIKTGKVDITKNEIAYENRDSSKLLFNYYRESELTNISAYTSYNNVVFYLSELNYIKGFNISDDTLYLGYDSNINLEGLLLTTDFFGHIKEVKNMNDDFKSTDYFEYNFYSNGIGNYDLTTYNNKEEYTNFTELDFNDVSEELIHASLYDGKFEASINDEYLSYSIDTNGTLVLVRSDGKLLSYEIVDGQNIRLSNNYDYSLYLLSNNTYYSLYTTIKNN